MGDTGGLTYGRAVETARNAADAAYANYGPGAFTWLEALEGASYDRLAQYLVGNKYATAAHLYHYAVGRAPHAARYDDIPLALKIGLEVFRSSFLALVAMVETVPAVRLVPSAGLAIGVSALSMADAGAALQRRRAIEEFQRSAPVAADDLHLERYESQFDDDGRPKKRGKR